MFDEIFMQLEPAGVRVRKMFGHRCLMIGRKGFAVDHDDTIVMKLPEPERSRALALEGSHLFDPAGGRPMKEWVVISAEYADDWPDYARVAMRYVAELAGGSL